MTTAVVNKDHFRGAVFAVSQFVDPDSSRYALGSILTIIDDQFIRMVATDGRALCTVTVPAKTSGKGELLIGKGDLAKLKIGAKNEADFLLTADAGLWEITNGKEPLRGLATEGRFPLWDKVIPAQTPEATLTGTRGAFSELYPSPPPGQLLAISGSGLDSCLSDHDAVYAAKYDKGLKTTGLGQVYLARDYVHTILSCWNPKETITLEMRDVGCAAVFKSDPERAVQITCVLMPLSRGKQ